MKTIFDFNVTTEELKELGVSETESFYIKNIDEESANTDLAFLFWNRGEQEKAEQYAEKLPDLVKNDFYRSVNHP